MASSDDEAAVPQLVTNYHFVDKDGVPISFSTLPIIFDNDEKVEAPSQQVSIRGTKDGGLQSAFKDVVAWKLNLDGDAPEVSVLSKDNTWIKIEKPKKSYEECFRTTLVTMHMLHFSKKNPEASVKSFWEHLHQNLSLLDDRPSQDNFRDHITIIKMFLDRDTTLANSQILLSFIKDPEKAFAEGFHKGLEEKPFIIDDEIEDAAPIDDGEESEEESDLFDSVCSICDNGGELLCCEGRCLRSFHATKKAGEDSDCNSLGLTRFQVEAMQNFLCKNCQLKQHQCFACGKLGSSDKSANAEVFTCVSATCGRFYHPKCVADLLFPENKTEATEFGKRIAAGESFTCPLHRCIVCKQVENKEVGELQFAICRRCPKAYHRKCLPRKIAFEDDDEDEDIIQRAWDGLLPNRILIYCLKHEIDEELGTPRRNHIVFPELPEKKREKDAQKSILKKTKLSSNRMSGDLKLSKPAKRFEKVSTFDDLDYDMLIGGKVSTKNVLDSQNKGKLIKKDAKPALKKVESMELLKSDSRKAEKLFLDSEKTAFDKANIQNSSQVVHGKFINSAPKIMPEIRKDVLTLVENESKSITHDEIRKMLSTPSTYSSSVGQIDKSITLGKIEGAIEAVRNALEKLERGGNVEDAKAVCEPEILKRLIKWNVKLKVYLAPVLHGARYSSYGRHFTKFDKLQEIVDKLQWYAQDGDMIVDFCCGANEFSILMKEKLDTTGKKCSFKNYDILQSKNDFNFELRDWMTVRPNELPFGSKLIMGLNPPFGLNAHLANKFIDKALTFKPKLLILIVPEETRRLDTKNPQYDLVWEDRMTLSGKSFYLPGSIDVNDKQIEQWNVRPPVLYLWSRPDWTEKHKGIASCQGHKSKVQSSFFVHKDSQPYTREDTSLADKNSEEKYKEKESNQGDRENMSLKEDTSAIPSLVQVNRREEASEQRESRKEMKRIHEGSEKRESAPARKDIVKEVHKKKQQHLQERSEKKTDLQGEKDSRQDAGMHIKKRKSLEAHKDATKKKKTLKEQQQQQKQAEGEDLPDMSISPSSPPSKEPIPPSQTPALGSLDGENIHGGYAGLGAGVRNISSVGRSSGIYEDPDSLHRRFGSTERESFYTSSPHGLPGTEFYSRDYSAPVSEERFRGYSPSQYGRNGYGRPDADLRMQSRTYGSMQGEDVPNSYGRSEFRNYSTHGEEASNGYGRSAEPDFRTQVRPYGMLNEEGHSQGTRFSLGSSGSLLGQNNLYPTPTYTFPSPAIETSATQRYAPRLDELNHLRPRHLSPGLPFPGRELPGLRRDNLPDSFPKPGSFGWIDD